MAEEVLTIGHFLLVIGGGALGYIGSKIQHLFDATDVARDALVDFGLTLGGIEDSLKRHSAEPKLSEADGPDYLQTNFVSDSLLFPPSVTQEKLLAAFDDQLLREGIILFFDRFRRFDSWRALRRESFYWLVDRPKIRWSGPGVKERVADVNATRDKMVEATKELLLYGHLIAEELFRHCTEGWTLRFDLAEKTARLLEERYRWTERTLRVRRAYYSLEEFPESFQEGATYQLVQPEFPEGLREARLRVSYGSRVYVLRHGVEVALPDGSPTEIALLAGSSEQAVTVRVEGGVSEGDAATLRIEAPGLKGLGGDSRRK